METGYTLDDLSKATGMSPQKVREAIFNAAGIEPINPGETPRRYGPAALDVLRHARLAAEGHARRIGGRTVEAR
ncbi:MAG TPA: hypothetical protein PLL65_21295 [Phycisphaerae bacterium]|nr:hypothetical protein [Phycisphaerae bacterium]